MSPKKLVFSLQDLHHGWGQAILSDGTQQATITASSIPEEPLLPLLWVVRLLLLGAEESKCLWWEEPGQYRWLFSRIQRQLQIHIVWFAGSRVGLSDEKGKTVVRLEGDLLAFAKRLAHQLSQLEYQEGKPAVAHEEYQKLKDAIMIFEHAQFGKQTK